MDRPGHSIALLTRLPPLVGRRTALAETKALLAQTALLTLTGPGGCGKTRLAIELARNAGSAYPDGVWVVELAPLLDPTALPEVVAAAIGLQAPPNLAAAEELVTFLRPRRALLVFDNCEHLLPACVELMEMLLAGCPHLRILATSREILNSALEVAWPVPPLSLPNLPDSVDRIDTDSASVAVADAVGSSAAVQLFVQRAAAVLPSFTLTHQNAAAIAQICRRLDGLPLAIELAAHCVNALALEQIAAQLEQGMCLLGHGYRTAAPRQRSLHATMEWSYRLLTPEEQALFRRLSALVGTFELRAAVAVHGRSPDTVLNDLRRLVDASLVTATQREGGVRYTMLETLRQFGREQLRIAGEEVETCTRYCAWVATLADAAASEGRDQALWLARCDREVEHLRFVLGWMVEHRQVEGALRLATSLLAFWRQRGHIGEGRRWLERTLAAGPDRLAIPPALCARALNGLGVLLMWQCEYAHAQTQHEEALALCDAAGDQPGVARTLFRLGFLADRRGDYQTAIEYLERSLRICSALDDPIGVDLARSRLGIAAWNQGECERAADLLERSLAFQGRQGHLGGCASTLLNLGMLALECGDADRAALLLGESLALNQALGDRLALCYVHTALGYVALHRSDLSSCAQAFGEARAVLDAQGNPEIVFRLLDGIAMLAARRGQRASAAYIWGAMNALRSKHELVYRAVERQRYKREVAAARRAIGPRSFAQTWHEGGKQSLADILGEAWQVLPVPTDGCAGELAKCGEAVTPKPPLTTPEADRGDWTAAARAGSSAGVTPLADEPQPKLYIHALGQVRAYRGERLITATDLTYSKARELLYFLLRHGPTTKEQIGLALWPDASPDYLRTTFRVVIHHLRRALGPEVWIVREQQYYAFNRSLPHWYDVEAFEAAVHDAQRLRVAAPGHAVVCLESARTLYRGDFWEGMTSGDWIAQEQERLRRSYLEALLTLGELYRGQGAARQAMDAYVRASERDPYCEEAHRGIIRCYLELDEPGRAARHFERWRRELKAQLGLAPAAETVALLRAHL
jgi:non-specific serine/threonine protein kinase